MGMLDTAVTGLLASQRGLAVTSNNIANVNTPGYSRQVVTMTTREPQQVGNGFIGKGVQITDIKRVHDEFLNAQVRSSIAANGEVGAYLDLAQRIDNMLADEQTGLSTSIQNFFNAVQDVSNLPSSMTSRQVMLSEAQSLAARFQFLDARMQDLTNESRIRLDSNVSEINSIARAIADINGQIATAAGQTGNKLPNDLLDQRDKLIEDLSGYVNVSTLEQPDHTLNVSIGKGQPLVLGTKANRLEITNAYQGHVDISLTDAFSSSVITDSISGGQLAGILNFQSEMLEPVRNALGRLAYGVVQNFNAQHELGMTMDGNVGQSFFYIASPGVLPQAGALNNVTASITDPSKLTTSDYSLVYNGANSYTLTRLSDNQATTINTGGGYPYASAEIDGFVVDISAPAGAIGDQYIIQPTINGAGSIGVDINDPRKIAAAEPLRAGEVTNSSGLPANTGNAGISPVSNSSNAGVPLATPVTLTFDAGTSQFIVSTPPGGVLNYDPLSDGGGKQFNIAAAGNASFVISGTPADGDQFIIENNSNADGDNGNALKLASLQSALTMLNGTASFVDSYGSLVADIGSSTRQHQISSAALDALQKQAVETRDSLTGVNLEEEAGNMLKYQQAFQAAAQLISVSETLFQSLINAFQ